MGKTNPKEFFNFDLTGYTYRSGIKTLGVSPKEVKNSIFQKMLHKGTVYM
jgi:hypothetical protein